MLITEGFTHMPHSQDNEKYKPTARKGTRRTAGTKTPQSTREPEKKVAARPMLQAHSVSTPAAPVLTEEVFRARVARKAFELYEKRRALTEVDDWVEAERLIKLELLGEELGGGSV